MALSKKSRRRLYTLVRFMANLPASANKHFNMEAWFRHMGEDHHGLKEGPVNRQHMHLCGTTACAMGWACMVPSFRKAGLRLVNDGTSVGEVRYRGATDGDAAEDFFGIGAFAVDDLFSAMNKDRTPKQWAKRARLLVQRWSKAAAQ